MIFLNYSGSVALVRALSRRLPCCMAKPQALEGERVAFAGGGNIRLRAGGHVAGGFLLLILSLHLLGGPPDCSAAVVASAADHLPRLGRLGELRQRSLRQELDPVAPCRTAGTLWARHRRGCTSPRGSPRPEPACRRHRRTRSSSLGRYL